jgi:hypothetical protein
MAIPYVCLFLAMIIEMGDSFRDFLRSTGRSSNNFTDMYCYPHGHETMQYERQMLLQNTTPILRDWIRVLSSTIQPRTFCPLVCCLKITIWKTVVLPVVLCGCEMWTLTVREEHNTKGVSERCWGDHLDWRQMKWQEGGENCIMRSLVTYFAKYN